MMRFLPVNLDALMVELDDLAQTLALLESLQAEPVAGIEELVPAARTLLIRYRPTRVSHEQLVERIWLPGEQSHEKRRRYAQDGIPIAPVLLKELNQLAAEIGIAPLAQQAHRNP